MQLFRKIFGTFSLLFLFVTSFVYSKPHFKIESIEGKSFILNLKSEQSFDVTVKLKDTKGLVLIEEEIDDTLAFSKKYNLNLLKSGNYTLIIEDKASICKLPMALAKNRLEVDFSNQKEITKPIFLVHKKSVDVILVIPEKTHTEMYMYDQDSNTIYSKKAKYSESIRRRFDISKLEAGNYTLSVIIGGVSVSRVYTIRNGKIVL